MKRIGLLSDTHGHWDHRFQKYFSSCHEIWHAGDIGTMDVIERLRQICPVRAVTGNIDGRDLSLHFPKVDRWQCEGADIMMTHIGGYPGRYDARIRKQLYEAPPQLFISGHSHILKVQYDDSLSLLHINPGAAGIQGWQQVRTLVRFSIEDGVFKDLEVIEL